MRAGIVASAALVLTAWTAPVQAHGGSFGGPSPNPGKGPGAGLTGQPTAPPQTGNVPHTWLTWWGYQQLKYLDVRRRQAERRGPVTGEVTEDAEAWRDELRVRLVPLMLESLRDEDKEVRTAAAVALGKFRELGAIPALQALHRDDNVQEVREAALLGLMLLRHPPLGEYLREIASRQGEQIRLREFALIGLGLLDDEPSRRFLLDLFDPGNARMAALVPKTSRKRREFLVAAAAGLQQSRKADLAADLLRLARDGRQEEEVRAFCVAALGKGGFREHLDAVARVLARDPEDQMRRSAAVALATMGRPEDAAAVKALGRAFRHDRDKIVRHFSILALGQIGGSEASRLLRREYPFAHKEERGFYMLAFGLSRDDEAVPLMKERLVDAADAFEAAAAALAFGLTEHRAHAPLVRERLASSKDWLLKQTCMLSLAILDDGASADTIRDLLVERKQVPVRMSAALAYAMLRQDAALPVLLDLLSGAETVQTLTGVVQACEYLRGSRVAPELERLVRDGKLQRQCRAYALVALGRLADRDESPVLVRLAFDMNYFIRCNAVDELVTIL